MSLMNLSFSASVFDLSGENACLASPLFRQQEREGGGISLLLFFF